MADGAESWARHMPEELVGKFSAARQRVRRVIFAKGWLLVVLAACVCFGMSVLLDRLLFLRSRYRLALLVGCLAAMGTFLLTYLIVPLARRISARRVARSVEEKHPELQDLLLSAVELSEQLASGETYTSKELIGAVSQETARKTRGIDFRSVVPLSAVGKPLLVTLGVVCALGAYCYFRPMIAQNVLWRVLYPYSGPKPLTFTELEVLPGNVLVPVGSDLKIKAIARGKIPKRAVLYLNRKGDRWDKVLLPRKEGGEFRYVLNGLLNPLRYRMRAGDARSVTFSVSVSERPVIVGIDVAYKYPEYTGKAPETKSDSGDILAVRGSKVKITARSNKPLNSAKLKFGDGAESLVSISGSIIRSQEFDVIGDESYSFDLVDKDGFRNLEAITHRIQAVEDKVPVVGITSPDRYSDARPDEVVPVDFQAVDDFGIEKMWLEYTIRSSEPKEEKDKVAGEERKGVLAMQLAVPGKREIEGQYVLSLSDLTVKEGDLFIFRVVAEDNNLLSGPGTGSSPEHTIRIVSDEASLRRIEQEQQDLARRLLRLIQEQKENKELADTLRQAVRGKESLSQAEKGSMEKAKSVQGAIEEAGRQLAGDFAEVLDEMRLNPMIQPRTIIEMADVTKALTGVSREEMPQATRKASEAARSKEAKERERTLAETSALQQKIIEALEEVSDQFAKLQDQQRLLALADAAMKLAKQQLMARNWTAAALPELAGLFPEKLTEEQKRRLRKLVDEQEKLSEKLSDFEERLRTLRKQLEYASSRDSQMIASALKYFERGEESSIPGDVNEAIEALRANHLHKGMRSQTQVYESLLRLAEEFQKAQMVRIQGQFFNMPGGLQFQQPEIDKLIEIQRAIIGKTEALPRGTDEKGIEAAELEDFEKVSLSQKDLLRRTSNFRAILEEIFENLVLIGIDPVSALKGAEQDMGKAAGSLEKLQAVAAVSQENDSLKNLEKARDELANALARMMASANLQQAMLAMSALEKMILEQKKVNEGTISLDQEASEKKEMTDPMLETLRQLVDRQAGLRDVAAGMKDYLKMMLKAGEMMGRSAERLQNKQTGQQTQQLQSQILELLIQMLVKMQAEASAMAEAIGLPGTTGTGAHGGVVTEPILREAPVGLDDRWANLPPRIKQELLEAWTEKFSPEFRELIALYYKRLSGEESPQ